MQMFARLLDFGCELQGRLGASSGWNSVEARSSLVPLAVAGVTTEPGGVWCQPGIAEREPVCHGEVQVQGWESELWLGSVLHEFIFAQWTQPST